MYRRYFGPGVITCFAAIATLAVSPVQGATLCVNPGGQSGCFSRISDAVTSASASDTITVAPGVYSEAVVITKSLSLSGMPGAIIDATGLSVGIFINGMNTANLRGINIAGLTVRNANFEGILIANASAVTVSSNYVTGNNKALSNATCPGLPAFETNEQMDCGEGIHLLGADHSIVTNNTVEGNSGGILLADDTGATHDNLISYNTVRDNPYACGITLASHPPAAMTGSATALGVYHNTIYGNRTANDGTLTGGGAGVGLFASVPGAKTYGNVVVNNLANDNGLPGVAMHAHVPGQDLSDNMIVGNTIVNNGPDSADSATPGTTGINVYGAGAVNGTIISGNSIRNEAIGVAVNTSGSVQVQFNSLLATGFGVDNIGTGSVFATGNWWGCVGGPGAQGCSGVMGSGVQTASWLTTPIPATPIF